MLAVYGKPPLTWLTPHSPSYHRCFLSWKMTAAGLTSELGTLSTMQMQTLVITVLTHFGMILPVAEMPIGLKTTGRQKFMRLTD